MDESLSVALAALPPGFSMRAGGSDPSFATDVLDLAPYEARRGVLTLESPPSERFSRGTWTQIDFLVSNLCLPFVGLPAG